MNERTSARIDKCNAIGMRLSFNTGGPWGYVTDALPAGHLDSTDIICMDDEEFNKVIEVFDTAIKAQKAKQQ